MTADALDPAIYVPARLRIVVTLAALPDGGALERYTGVLRRLAARRQRTRRDR